MCPYEPHQTAMRQQRKEKDIEEGNKFLRFFAEDLEAFRKSQKKALDEMKRHSRRLKKEK